MQVSKTRISKYLSSCAFDPKSPGPLSAAIKLQNPNYLELKAVELIQQARMFPFDQDFYESNIRQAIQLLSYAGAEHEAIRAENEKAGRKDSGRDPRQTPQAGMVHDQASRESVPERNA